jgi:23S rRNA (adenine2503-C2)-methyltransferase
MRALVAFLLAVSPLCHGWLLPSKTSVRGLADISRRGALVAEQQDPTADDLSPFNDKLPRSSPLALSMDDLSRLLEGRGRALMVWEYLRQGLDPWDGTTLEGGNDGVGTQQQLKKQKESSVGELPVLGQRARFLYEKSFGTSLSASIASLIHTTRANDGTTKLLLQMKQDGLQVETVLIPWEGRQRSTLCVSSQVGCKQGCTFCLTGKMGKLRSLTTDEILIQVAVANAICRSHDIYPVDNIVFMGMGEPADNAAAVVQAARVLTDPFQFHLAPRRVTISTVAPDPSAFTTLGQAPAVLAWSVHATSNELRRELVPTTRHSMEELRESLIATLQGRSRRLRAVMLEITLLDQVNDTPEAAHLLADFCQPLLDRVASVKLVVNLIPWNDIGASFGPAASYRKPSPERIAAYQAILVERGILCYVRLTRGDDESSACGQLATQRRSSTKEE